MLDLLKIHPENIFPDVFDSYEKFLRCMIVQKIIQNDEEKCYTNSTVN